MGTGIQLGAHITPESRLAFERADEAFYLVADAGSAAWIERLRPTARSLHHHYASGRPRTEIYEDVVEEILRPVREGSRVCAALYGHPGVFSHLGHEAVRRARDEGFGATMLPAVSAHDCLIADLGVDPGRTGCQTYEATDFLVNRRTVDTSAALILWQVTVIAQQHASATVNIEGIRLLAERLMTLYSPAHEVTLYESSPYPVARPAVLTVSLERLHGVDVTPLATLYVPPARSPRPDLALLERLRTERR